ncbi:TIGR04255 family protein [Bradyrhizobium oligotrophicum]|nr:TIGR04255 family protein [Bradyrhizobium oligotrophicum]
MMPFKPINEDHAIQSASFAIGLSQPIPWPILETLIKRDPDWRRDLPAIDLPQALDIVINPATGAPQNRILRGVEFSHKRPDGSASWVLSLFGTEIRVTTTLYTRWQPTWDKARDILSTVGRLMSAALDQTKPTTVQSIALSVSDVFIFDETADKPDYSHLFKANEEIPSSAFSKGRLWHSHTGWFIDRPLGATLNQLNVDVRTGVGEDLSIPGVPDEQLRVVVQHNQLFRPSQPIQFVSSNDDALQGMIAGEMPVMHEANKAILQSILTDEMQARIKVKR